MTEKKSPEFLSKWAQSLLKVILIDKFRTELETGMTLNVKGSFLNGSCLYLKWMDWVLVSRKEIVKRP